MTDGAGVLGSGPTQALVLAATAHSNAAFAVVFGIFVVALLILAVVVVTWAIRRDRNGLREWRRRRVERGFDQGGNGAGRPSSGNGHRPAGGTDSGGVR